MGLVDLNTLAGTVIAFVLGITLHEFAHAWVAYQFGDSTPARQGRLTLDPRAHMTLWGTLLIFLIGFGWGRPVQHGIWDLKRRMWVSLAGPLTNLLIALPFGLLLRAGVVPRVGPEWFFLPQVVYTIVVLNVLLAFFNLIPLAPLDGSTVFAALLPHPYDQRLANYNARYPQALIVFLLVDFLLARSFLGQSILWTILGPPIRLVVGLLTGT